MTHDHAHRLRAFYRRYIDRCNAHDFSSLSDFVSHDVEVNGEPVGLSGYVAGLHAVIEAFPDYHWDLRHLLVENDWLAAHFACTGTHEGAFRGVPPTGRRLQTQEFVMYRFANGAIAEVWGTADNAPMIAGDR
jgi:predicted ester cyclase